MRITIRVPAMNERGRGTWSRPLPPSTRRIPDDYRSILNSVITTRPLPSQGNVVQAARVRFPWRQWQAGRLHHAHVFVSVPTPTVVEQPLFAQYSACKIDFWRDDAGDSRSPDHQHWVAELQLRPGAWLVVESSRPQR